MPTKPLIRIGSRGSELALWQAHFVKKLLEELGCEVSIQIIVTQGDRIQNLSFDKLEGKGFFTKEIEDALLSKTVDLAVHSHKDLVNPSPTLLSDFLNQYFAQNHWCHLHQNRHHKFLYYSV